MADTKLTDLTAASAFAPTDFLYAVISGNSRKVPVSLFTAATTAEALAYRDAAAVSALAAEAYNPVYAGVQRIAHAPASDVAVGNPRPIDVIGNVVIGAIGDTIYTSSDSGVTWSEVGATTGSYGDVLRVIACSDGEVLVLRNNALLKSVGWPTPTSWTLKASTPGQYIEWGLDGDGNKFILSEYSATPYANSRYIRASLDAGDTWAVIFDKLDYPVQDTQTHLHGVAYDRWADRFWYCSGDMTYKGIYFSDDDGASWTEVPIASVINGNVQCTTISATPHGMVLGSDDGTNNGLARILRTEDPSDMRVEMAWRWPHRQTGIRGFARRNFFDGVTGITYTAWRTDQAYARPMITWCDGKAGGVLYEYEGAWAANDVVRNVIVAPNGRIMAWISLAGEADQVLRLGYPRFGAVVPAQEDAGCLLGGSVTAGRSGVAVGPDAISAQFSVAIGAQADADRTGAMAIGWQSVGGVNGTSVGMQAVSGDQGVSAGRQAVGGSRSVVVGYSADAGADSIAIGREASASGSSSVVIGTAAASDLNSVVVVGVAAQVAANGVAVGYGAKTQDLDGVAIGTAADVVGQYGTAIGRSAVATGNRSIAVGNRATAPAGNSVVVGVEANSVGANCVVIGDLAKTTTGSDSVVLGRSAEAGAQWGVAIGTNAKTTAQNSVAVGLGAIASHLESVALGRGSTTEVTNSVSVGERDLQILGNGTKGIVMRSPDGTRYRLQIANGGTITISAF